MFLEGSLLRVLFRGSFKGSAEGFLVLFRGAGSFKGPFRGFIRALSGLLRGPSKMLRVQSIFE